MVFQLYMEFESWCLRWLYLRVLLMCINQYEINKKFIYLYTAIEHMYIANRQTWCDEFTGSAFIVTHGRKGNCRQFSEQSLKFYSFFCVCWEGEGNFCLFKFWGISSFYSVTKIKWRHPLSGSGIWASQNLELLWWHMVQFQSSHKFYGMLFQSNCICIREG